MWHTIGLIGRDSLIRNDVSSRINTPDNFYFEGRANCGLSAVLEFTHELNHNTGKCFIDADRTHGDNLKKIIADWQVSGAPVGVDARQTAIIQHTPRCVLYVDNLHLASPKSLRFLKALMQWHSIRAALRKGNYKKELKDLIASMDCIRIKSLAAPDALNLAENMIRQYGKVIDAKEVVKASDGLPGRMLIMAQTGKVFKPVLHLKSDEIDESPLLLIGLALIVILRVFGLVADDRAMYLIGGCGMFFLLLGRLIVGAGKK